ncbi:MAG: hypothetical protein HGN29_13675 [Asgard group archaeon]|nr:hypothetical protein [Asgard group archaeon]
MVQFVKCKVCGYVIKESKLGDLCPACGVKKSAFEPYEPTISEKRMKILEFHIHPILVHFPQGFIPFILGISILVAILNEPIQTYFLMALRILSVALPFVLVAALSAGILDGKIRFKSITTPMLKQKIMVGSTAIILSILLAVSAFLIDSNSLEILWSITLSLILLGCSVFLGYVGGHLTCSVRVGK